MRVQKLVAKRFLSMIDAINTAQVNEAGDTMMVQNFSNKHEEWYVLL